MSFFVQLCCCISEEWCFCPWKHTTSNPKEFLYIQLHKVSNEPSWEYAHPPLAYLQPDWQREWRTVPPVCWMLCMRSHRKTFYVITRIWKEKEEKPPPFAQWLYSTAQGSLFISKCWWQWKWKCIFLSLLRSESQCQPFNLSSREAFFITHIVKVKVYQLLLGEQSRVEWFGCTYIFHVAAGFALNNIVWSNLCLKPQWLKPQRHLLPNLSAFKCWGPRPVVRIKVG